MKVNAKLQEELQVQVSSPLDLALFSKLSSLIPLELGSMNLIKNKCKNYEVDQRLSIANI